MRLKRYGIGLDSLNNDHLEMVRLWRNQEFVRCNMQFKELISREQQEAWFENLDKERNLYWVIRTHEYPIGLIHIKNIDWRGPEGEAGIFVGEPSYLSMPQPMLAILFMMELAFEALEFTKLKAKIRSGNTQAIEFNQKLGYQLLPGQPEGFQYYVVNQQEFNKATSKLRGQSSRMYGDVTEVLKPSVRTKVEAKLIAGIQESERLFNAVFP
jgi:RimJ/RimL family protein N-acetyltransferase